jgi:hypothetical protein
LSVDVFAQYGGPASGAQYVDAPPSPPPHPAEHVPPTQVCAGPQALPHAPQLALSVSLSTQYGAPPSGVQRRPLAPAQGMVVQLPPVHASPTPQAWPQLPQFALSVAVVAQNAPPSPVHIVWSAAQTDEHLPLLQASSAAQAVPHAPQFCGSVLTSLQTPAQRLSPAEHVVPPPPSCWPASSGGDVVELLPPQPVHGVASATVAPSATGQSFDR